jgi:membrane fusion protein, multidrug efflux system
MIIMSHRLNVRSSWVVLALAGAVAACGGDEAAPPDAAPTAVPVTFGAVRRDTVSQPVQGTGTYGSRDELTLSFKIGGIVSRVHVDDGESVRAGQVLASLDLREIDAMRAKAQVAVDKATRDLARLRTLFADSVVTRAQLQDTESSLAAAEADLAAATVNREFAVITAPGAGRVLRRAVDAGALVAPGQEVLRVANDARGRVVRLGVSDRDAVRLRVGQRAEVHFDALPEQTFQGRIALVGAATDQRTGTIPVEIAVVGADALPSGAVATVRIAVPAKREVSLIPVESLVEADGDSATVYSAVDGRARRHRVRVRFVNGAYVAVDGVDADNVITSGAGYVRDSIAVRRVEGVR